MRKITKNKRNTKAKYHILKWTNPLGSKRKIPLWASINGCMEDEFILEWGFNENI